MFENIKSAGAMMCILGGLTTFPASATVVGSIPGGVIQPMPAVNYPGSGPQVFGSGITWSSTTASIHGGSAFGYTGFMDSVMVTGMAASRQWPD